MWMSGLKKASELDDEKDLVDFFMAMKQQLDKYGQVLITFS